MSVSAFPAAPHSSEASVKAVMPRMNTRLRPNRSPSLLPVTSSTANARVYPASTHWTCA